MTTRTKAGKSAEDLITAGVSVAVDLEYEEDGGMDEDLATALLPILQKWGTKKVLTMICEGALCASDACEESVEKGDMAPLRLRIFSSKLRDAMNTLK